MKNYTHWLLVLFALITILVNSGCTVGDTMWEYKEIYVNCYSWEAKCFVGHDESNSFPDRTSLLNTLGKQGWEIIYVSPNSYSSTYAEFILKRPIK
jgi:hypothetical protein